MPPQGLQHQFSYFFPLPFLAQAICLLTHCHISNFLVWVLATKAFFPFVISVCHASTHIIKEDAPSRCWSEPGRGRMATASYRHSMTEVSVLLRLFSLLWRLTLFYQKHSSPQPRRCMATSFSLLLKTSTLKHTHQGFQAEDSHPEVMHSLCHSHPREGHTHAARVLRDFILLWAIRMNIGTFSRQWHEPFLLWRVLYYHKNSS